MRKLFLPIFCPIFCLFILSSCVETTIIGTAATIAVVTQKPDLGKSASNISLATNIRRSFNKNSARKALSSLIVTANNTTILLTGAVKDEETAALATDLTWKIKGVHEVIDEIQISPKKSSRESIDYLSDLLITSQVNFRILLDEKIKLRNFKITTYHKVVYLLGSATDEKEIRSIIELVSETKGVKKVINHIELTGRSYLIRTPEEGYKNYNISDI